MGAPFVVHANLDCEARWANVTLPLRVQQRISLLGSLVAALAPADDGVEVWAPVAVDPARIKLPVTMRAGTPPRADLSWADPLAKTVNDRRLALAIASAHEVGLAGAKAIACVDDIDLAGAWVVKAPWTAAGRDRCHGSGAPSPEQRTRIGRLLETFGALVLEPWCERIVDAGVCATVGIDGLVTAHPPHGLLVDRRGGFVGIDLEPPALTPGERDGLALAVAAAGNLLADHGYVGPFAIDAFAYRDGARKFQPLCEINARFSFGWIARALAQRRGTTKLGFTADAPAGATTLIAPDADGVTAWIA